ncbi:SKP1-like protein 21 isoform X1 [Musa acuminata AAA Group]|uniref:SKP1 component dimerisation domain-containing protein n=1 Tax=Musa acuminata subsp. malaccensis TaxID=214687 RepID=A0A804K5E5_MUSAM|nr:PREDICTED: SKP1-like protein 21 isoform X1 [Musa acuminata subsp. malaccensis]XP_009411512.1 PREDICTED: SKP1-like protein 21 isoform X1 [Musa acuminata subsp. malaccensis]
MSESEKAIIKPEAMKSFIWLQCADGSIQQVEEEVATFCPMIYREIVQTGMGSSKNYAISLPEHVNPAILNFIFDYCRFHQVPGRSNRERKSFDEKFIRMDTKRLCELTSAADSLQLKPLVDLTSRALARMIEGKSPEEIRETFHLPDDLTEVLYQEEKLEPLKNVNDDPRIRLLNRLYAKKRKELKEQQKLKSKEADEEKKEERSVDEILSFINGHEDSKGVKAIKNKKKNRRKKVLSKDTSGDSAKVHRKKEDTFSPSPSQNLEVQGNVEDAFVSNVEFGDGDIDDELDPAVKEELDREVEDFARRLNSDWPERMQEILSLGQDRRLVPNLVNSNGSVQKFAGLDGR